MSPTYRIYPTIQPVDNYNLAKVMHRWLDEKLWHYGNIPLPPSDSFKNLFHNTGVDLAYRIIKEFGYTVPSRELITTVRKHLTESGHCSLVSIGSGTGYIECLFNLAGIETVATDKKPNEFVEELDAAAAIRKYPGRGVFVSWPEPWVIKQTIAAIRLYSPTSPIFLVQSNRPSGELRLGYYPLKMNCGEPIEEKILPNFPQAPIYRIQGQNRLAVFGPPRDPA